MLPAVALPANEIRDPLEFFAPESDAGSARGRSRVLRTLVASLVAGVLLFSTLWAWPRWVHPALSEGLLRIDSQPSGVEVRIAGRSVGRTPLSLSLRAADTHRIELSHGNVKRTLPVQVRAGATTYQYAELANDTAPPSTASATGALHITTEPSGLSITIDGVPRGASPLDVELSLGQHEVVVLWEQEPIRRSVNVLPGQRMTLMVSIAPVPTQAIPASLAGWLSIVSPVTLQLFEDGRLLGTTESARIMVPVGAHEIDMVNDALGFRARHTLNVMPGRSTAYGVDLPRGAVSINAQPWAEVWIDGERVGETPIGNLSLPIGVRQIVLRHPELGERRESVLITLKETARIGVDLRRR